MENRSGTPALPRPGFPVDRPLGIIRRTPFGVGLRIGSLFGIEILADWSLLLVFALIAVGFGAGVLQAAGSDLGPFATWALAVAAAVLFFASLLAHELSHALVARAHGLGVRSITLFMLGGVAQIEEEPKEPRVELLMAIVGPLMSLFIGVIGIVTAVAMAGIPVPGASPGPLATLLFWLGGVNLTLGLFNLVPGFPLDGGRVLRAILWWATGDIGRATRTAARAGELFGWTLIALGVLDVLGLGVPFLGGGLLGGAWMVIVGWFIRSAARSSHLELTLKLALRGVPVSQLMLAPVVTVAAGTTVARLVDDRLLHTDQRAIAVLDGGRFIGLVRAEDAARVPQGVRADSAVEAIMTPAASMEALRPEDDAGSALKSLARSRSGAVPVLAEGVLVGLLRAEDVARWMQLAQRSV